MEKKNNINLDQIMDEISNKYHEISKILNYKTKKPYKDVEEYIIACYGDQSVLGLLDSPIVENIRYEWDTILEPIKKDNSVFLENTFAKDNQGEYTSGYLDGFKIACWVHKLINRIINAPIINDNKYGDYLGNGVFSHYFIHNKFAYPNELERSLHLDKIVTDLKEGALTDYRDILHDPAIDEIYQAIL